MHETLFTMKIPNSAQALIHTELQKLTESNRYTLEPDTRIEIYSALGQSNVNDELIREEVRKNNPLPSLSNADRLRAQIALITARKVEGLWSKACLETETNFSKNRNPAEIHREEETYLASKKQKYLEHIPVDDVPRAFIPLHILEMAELAMTGKIHDFGAFRLEANEWWQIYPRPEQMEREFCIKWAAQEALYNAIGWTKYNPEPPAEYALLAFAGIFEGDNFSNRRCIMDKDKQHEFWLWWLSKAIPQALSKDGLS